MYGRSFVLISALLAFPASAQSPCGVCAAGAQCVDGACQFSCTRDGDCHGGNVCIDGHCEPRLPLQRPGAPATIRRGDATHPERFKVITPTPPGFHLASEPSGEAIARGGITFGCAWLPMAIVALATRSPLMAIPVAGPILGFRPEGGTTVQNVFFVTAIVIDVALQLFGLFMTAAGFAIPSKWLERNVLPLPEGERVGERAGRP